MDKQIEPEHFNLNFGEKTLRELEKEKILARMKLLAMPPRDAQELVEGTLYPQLWKVKEEDITWTEAFPGFEDDEEDNP